MRDRRNPPPKVAVAPSPALVDQRVPISPQVSGSSDVETDPRLGPESTRSIAGSDRFGHRSARSRKRHFGCCSSALLRPSFRECRRDLGFALWLKDQLLWIPRGRGDIYPPQGVAVTCAEVVQR